MGVQLNFNAATVPPAEPGMPVWEGMVPVIIKRTEAQNTAKNDGNKFLAIYVMATGSHYQGQENVIRLNLWNSNATAADIASRQLSAICHVTGRQQVQDSDQLLGAQMLTVWAKEDREIVDQATGQRRTTETCQCKEFRYSDGRTIREGINGQPASSPYTGGSPAVAQPSVIAAPPPLTHAGGFAPSSAPGQFGAPPAMQPPAAPQGFQPPPPPGAVPQGFAPPAVPQMAPPAYQPPPPGMAPQPASPQAPAGFGPPGASPPVWGR